MGQPSAAEMAANSQPQKICNFAEGHGRAHTAFSVNKGAAVSRTMKLPLAVIVSSLLLIQVVRADDLKVQLSYVDNYRADPSFLPNLWCGESRTHFDGSSPNDGCSQIFDVGAIRLANLGYTPITVADVVVRIGSLSFDLWNQGGAFEIEPGWSEILSQLTPYDFDTSDTSPLIFGHNDGFIPTVTISFDGTTQTFYSGQVLNTSGFDQGAKGKNEGSPWQNTASTPEPSSLVLLGAGLLSLLRSRRCRPKAAYRSSSICPSCCEYSECPTRPSGPSD